MAPAVKPVQDGQSGGIRPGISSSVQIDASLLVSYRPTAPFSWCTSSAWHLPLCQYQILRSSATERTECKTGRRSQTDIITPRDWNDSTGHGFGDGAVISLEMEALPELNVLWAAGSPHRWGNSTFASDTPGSHPGFVVRLLVAVALWAAFNLVFYEVRLLQHNRRLTHTPPKPAAWEFLWQTYVLRRRPVVVLHNLVKRYGAVMYCKAGTQDVLVLSSVAAVEEFYKLHDMEFGARPSSMGRIWLSNSFNSLCFPPLATYWDHLGLVLDMTSSEKSAGYTRGIEWALEVLGRHATVVGLLCEELERHFEAREGDDRVLQESDIAKLPYLQAVAKELFRLHPPCTVSLPHQSECGLSMLGFELPPRTQVLVNIYSLQRDPVMWGDNAEEFDPARFVAHPEVDMLGQHFQLLPFGGGHRRCSGTKLAILHVQLGLARHFSQHVKNRS